MINVAIVEDDEMYIDKLREYLMRFGRENGKEFAVSVFNDGSQIVEKYKADSHIILMDIKMEDMDGLEAAKKIRDMDGEVIILFITNMPQYALEGYKVGALDYVLKPISYYAFSESLKRAVNSLKMENERYLVVSVRNGFQKLAVSEIRYVEVYDHDLIYHMLNGICESRGSIRDAEERINDSSFFKTNKAYLVNLRYVDAVIGNDVVLGTDRLQVSRARKKALMDALNAYMERLGM